MSDPEPLPTVAFYYPEPLWYDAESVKNLLLFFDGVGLLVPAYMEDRPGEVYPELVEPLREQGLLHILRPEEHVDQTATEELAQTITELITSGALDELAADTTTRFHELSRSRLGFYGDVGLAEMLLEELKARGLARDSEDGVSIPMHPFVRILILVLLSQILRAKGSNLGMELMPATDRPDLVDALVEVLSLPTLPSAGHVVAADMQTVGVDLSLVPMDEVLSFRSQYAEQHRRYALEVRGFVRDLSLLEPRDAEQALTDRQAELADLANDLRVLGRKSWKKPASWGISATGAAWALATGDPLGVILSAAGWGLGDSGGGGVETGAFTYLFSVPRRRYT